jgi:UDP-glucose 6-dehydrogenase
MKITLFGIGYVGLFQAEVFAAAGRYLFKLEQTTKYILLDILKVNTMFFLK